MGGMLSRPVTNTMLFRSGSELYRVGRTDMQGYRLNMEDEMTARLGLGGGDGGNNNNNSRQDWALFAVFDGHAGQKASAFLAEHLHEKVAALPDPFDAEALKQCVRDIDAEFCSDPARRMHGSTCVFAIVRPSNDSKTEFDLVVSNTGDSRVVIIRREAFEGGGATAVPPECVAMTSDHKPDDKEEYERIFAAGGTVSDNRTDGELAMSRAIGDYKYKMNADLGVDEQKVIPTPDITFETLRKGDRLLLMCDGIVECMENQEAADKVVEELKAHGDPAKACAALFQHSLSRGSKDNHSAIVVEMADGRDYGPAQEFVAGPFHPYIRDKQYTDNYIKDAMRWGISGTQLFELARVTEKNLNLPYVEVSDDVLVELQEHALGGAGGNGGSGLGGGGALDGAESFLNQLTPEQLQQFGPNQLLQLRKQIQEQQAKAAAIAKLSLAAQEKAEAERKAKEEEAAIMAEKQKKADEAMAALLAEEGLDVSDIQDAQHAKSGGSGGSAQKHKNKTKGKGSKKKKKKKR